MFRKGSKEKERFASWLVKVNECLEDGKNLIEDLQDLNEKGIEDLEKLSSYQELLHQFSGLEIKNIADETFSLKGKERVQEIKIRQEIDIFIEDREFFINEISQKINKSVKINNTLKIIEEIQEKLSKNESDQQKLARTIPRLNNTGEMKLAEEQLAKLREIVPEEINIDVSFPEEINLRIERANKAINEWNKKLNFIQSSLAKYQNIIQKSVKEEKHKEKLSSIHSWLDSSEVRVKRIKETIKGYLDLINDDSTPSKELLNIEKKFDSVKQELISIKAPDSNIEGENQTILGLENRIKELNAISSEISNYLELIYEKLNYRLAYVRTRILEKMFSKAHQLSFAKVNYSLGLRNELLLKGWLDEPKTNEQVEYLKNHLNKYLMLTNVSISNYKEVSGAIFTSIQDFTEYERLNNEVSYKASLKWLIQNDSKWLET